MEQNNNNKIETQNQIAKKKQSDKFNKPPIKEFVTEAKRREYGHICDSCSRKYRCMKCGNAIVIKCFRYEEKQNQKKGKNLFKYKENNR